MSKDQRSSGSVKADSSPAPGSAKWDDPDYQIAAEHFGGYATNAAPAPGEEPLRRAYSHEESIDAAMRWMCDNYGIARDMDADSRDRYHEKLGLLVDFLHTLHPPNVQAEGSAGSSRTQRKGTDG